MSLYHILFLWLLFGAVVEHIRKKTPKWLFVVTFAVLTIFLCLRFGQGTDYFTYASIYNGLPASPLQAIRATHIHSEIGWKVVCGTFRALGASFPVLIFVVSVYMMGLFYRFLQRYGGERKLFTLFIAYHTLYLTYFMSVLRQGIVIATLLGVLLPLLQDRKYIKYCIITALLALIHSVAFLLLLLPILQNLRLTFKHCVAIVALGFCLGVVLSVINVGSLIGKVIEHSYFKDTEISVVAVLERVASFAVVTFCYYIYSRGEEPEQGDFLCVIYKIYAIGIFLYGVLMWSVLISSRTVYILKVIEIILLCTCLPHCKKSRHIVLLYCVLLSIGLYVKNIDSYLLQGQYQNATVLNYPYVTIFNQTDILNYRQDTINYPFKW